MVYIVVCYFLYRVAPIIGFLVVDMHPWVSPTFLAKKKEQTCRGAAEVVMVHDV